MKKILLLLTIITLTFTACNMGNNNSSGFSIGKTGPGGGIIFFAEGNQYMEVSGELGSNTWAAAKTAAQNHRGGGFNNWRLPTRAELSLIYQNLYLLNHENFPNFRYWSSEEEDGTTYAWAFSLNTGTQTNMSQNSSNGVRAVRSFGPDSDPNGTTLTINNQSFTDITNVIWHGSSFSNNNHEDIIRIGTNVTEIVEPGAAYIFFRRSTSPVIARTNSPIIIEEGNQTNFTFTDNTLIVEANNPNNVGTLGALQSTVIWYDDAEGEYLQYQQRTNTTYSTTQSQQGERSIRMGTNAVLSFTINLERSARISFWHRYVHGGSTSSAALRINTTETKSWTTSSEWVFLEETIPAGNTTIQFTTTNFSELFLDNLLIHYID